MKSIASLQARLLNLSRERGTQFQDLLNSLGAEQFLYRLSISPYAENFIFKGGTLLTYLTESSRKTRDLDFSIKDLDGDVNSIIEIIKSVTEIPVDDGLVWTDLSGDVLSHPEMETPGVRAHCHFLLGKMKGAVHLDVARGDRVEAVLASLPRLEYRGEPFFSEELSLQVYSAEAIFAEKIYIAQSKGAQNTRMKDYYDLHRLCDHQLDSK